MSDFYQSPADKLRFEILLKSLREGRLNLAILGDDEVALAHYGRRIFQHLREQGEEHVELWTSADSDKLVDRFNDILSQMTLDQALDKTNKSIPKRYMIFPDTQGIQDFELQLLARLVNGFPASNINLILLINNASYYEKKLSAFGKNLLQWVLESEEPEAPAPVNTQTHKPLANANFTLPPAPAKPLEIVDLLPPADHLDLSSDPVMGEVVPGSDGPTGEELAQSWDAPPKKSLGGKIAAVLLASLLLSMGALGYIYHEQLLDEWANLESYLQGPSKAAPLTTSEVNAAATRPPPAPTVGMSSSNTPTPLKPTDAVSTEQGEAVVKAVDLPAKPPEPAKPAEPPKALEPAKPAEPVKPPEPPKVAKPAEKSAEKPADKSAETAAPQADDVAWVRQLKDEAWVMQHGAFDSLSEARSFQSSSLGYKAGQVFFTQRKGSKPYFILITGPYAEKSQAEALMRQNPPLAKAWLRSAKSLKLQFPD
jgi:cell division septation protein DedD